MTTGDHIRYERKRAKLTLRELSQKVNMTIPSLSYIETNKTKSPSIDLVRNVAKSLGIPIGYLIDGRPDRKQCDTCYFYAKPEFTDREPTGQCHRYPPQPIMGHISVYPHDWCGEWKSIQEEV